MPVPAGHSVLEAVARTCHDLVDASTEDVQLEDGAITAFAAQLSPSEVQASAVYVRIPIKFDSVEAEVNYLGLFHLLDFGSGWDSLLMQKAGRDAHEAIQFGLLGLLMTDARIDSHHFLREFSAFQVFNFFGIDASEESEVMPGITMTRAGPLAEFVKLIKETLNETGRILGDIGSKNLGAFVLSFLEEQQAAGQPATAAALVEKLADTFPAFDDKALCQDKQVFFYRKAQALAAQLKLRFGGEDAKFAFQDMQALTLDSGSMVAALLRQHGVVKYSEDMTAVVDGGEDFFGDPKEAVLRAATVEAGQRICAAAGGVFLPFQLSLHLLHRAQSRPEEYAQLKKFVCKGTVAY